MARKKLFVFDAESFHFGEAPRKIGRAVLTLLLAIGTLPLKVPAAEGTDYEEEQAGQASEAVQEAGAWKILLPAENEQTGYVIKPIGSTAVPEGGSFTFSLSITDGYKKGKNFAVKAGF